jgi:AcrR family transcriptional regulator
MTTTVYLLQPTYRERPMRVRTEAKRETIIQVASEVFLEAGFEGTSMAQISERLGGSKRTLYGYFNSKEELFGAVAHRASEALFRPLVDALVSSEKPLPVALETFGRGMVRLICDDQNVQMFRTMIGVAGRTDVGADFYDNGPAVGIENVSGYLQRHVEAGELVKCNSAVAAHHLNALLQAEILLPTLLGKMKNPSRKFVNDAADRAVKAFLDAYATARS